jgi:hypothetical protein
MLIVVRMVKSRRMRWAVNVAFKGDIRNTKFWSKNRNGGDHLEDMGVDGS